MTSPQMTEKSGPRNLWAFGKTQQANYMPKALGANTGLGTRLGRIALLMSVSMMLSACMTACGQRGPLTLPPQGQIRS